MPKFQRVFVDLKIRTYAFFWDYLIILGYMLLLAGVATSLLQLGLLQRWVSAATASPLTAQATFFLLLTFPVILYYATGEASQHMGTWGKVKAGLVVIGADGVQLSFPRALVRNILKLLPWELSHYLLWRIEGWPMDPGEPSVFVLIGFFFVWFVVVANIVSVLMTRQKQTLYDYVTAAVVEYR